MKMLKISQPLYFHRDREKEGSWNREGERERGREGERGLRDVRGEERIFFKEPF